MSQPIVMFNNWVTPVTTWGVAQIGGQFAVLEYDRDEGDWMVNCEVPTIEAAIGFIEDWIDDYYPNHTVH